MGWREWLGERFELWDAGGNASWDDWRVTVEDMPAPDRIALARELLAGTGMVVARDVGEKPREILTGSTMQQVGKFAEVTGWNACRAAMLGDDAQ